MNVKFVNDKILLKIENIENSLYTGIVYNFECNTHTYMCRNILTHNCDPYAIGQRGIIGQIRRTSLSRRQHRGKYSDCERLNITVQHRE